MENLKLFDVITRGQSEELKLLHAKYKSNEGNKYVLNQNRYFNEKLACFNELGLKEKIRYLDIGTGVGFLPMIFNACGHSGECVDIDTNPFFNDAVKILNVNRTVHKVEAFKPFYKFEEKFDVIISTRITFNNHARSELWGEEEWRYFIRDLQKSLNCGGFIRLFCNGNDKVFSERKIESNWPANVFEIRKNELPML